MKEELLLKYQMQISLRESSANFSALVDQDCIMNQSSQQQNHCFLCEQSMKSIYRIPIMGGDG